MRPRRDEDAEDGIALECQDCSSSYLVTDGEAAWYRERGWNLPVRCRNCRERRKLARAPVVASPPMM